MTRSASPAMKEAALLEPLLQWLRARRTIRSDTLVLNEFPWCGRRVDLAILNRSDLTTAYELKLNHTRRALEQSALNSLSFDRSYVVTVSRPTGTNLLQAVELGIGLILMTPSFSASILVPAQQRSVDPTVRRRLRSVMTSIGPAR